MSKSMFYTDDQGRTRYMGGSRQKQSTTQVKAVEVAPTRKKAGFFYQDEEGRTRFAGGPDSGAGGTSGGSFNKATYIQDRADTSTGSQAYDFLSAGLAERASFAKRDTRSKLKDEVISEISSSSGVPYETVNKVIAKWAEYPLGNDPDMLAIQQEAAKIFNTSLSSFQLQNIAKLGKFEPEVASRDEIRSILSAMHANTQRQLSRSGLPEYITLRRGVFGSDLKKGQIQEFQLSPLNSFTTSKMTASGFGDRIIEIQIPRNRILSTARSGFGNLNETEFVIIGSNGTDQVLVLP